MDYHTRFPINETLPSLRVIKERDPDFLFYYTFNDLTEEKNWKKMKAIHQHWAWRNALAYMIKDDDDDDTAVEAEYIREGNVDAPLYKLNKIRLWQ